VAAHHVVLEKVVALTFLRPKRCTGRRRCALRARGAAQRQDKERARWRACRRGRLGTASPYMVMEGLLRGRDRSAADGADDAARGRCRLLAAAGEAIAVAHTARHVHRGLKRPTSSSLNGGWLHCASRSWIRYLQAGPTRAPVETRGDEHDGRDGARRSTCTPRKMIVQRATSTCGRIWAWADLLEFDRKLAVPAENVAAAAWRHQPDSSDPCETTAPTCRSKSRPCCCAETRRTRPSATRTVAESRPELMKFAHSRAPLCRSSSASHVQLAFSAGCGCLSPRQAAHHRSRNERRAIKPCEFRTHLGRAPTEQGSARLGPRGGSGRRKRGEYALLRSGAQFREKAFAATVLGARHPPSTSFTPLSGVPTDTMPASAVAPPARRAANLRPRSAAVGFVDRPSAVADANAPSEAVVVPPRQAGNETSVFSTRGGNQSVQKGAKNDAQARSEAMRSLAADRLPSCLFGSTEEASSRPDKGFNASTRTRRPQNLRRDGKLSAPAKASAVR